MKMDTRAVMRIVVCCLVTFASLSNTRGQCGFSFANPFVRIERIATALAIGDLDGDSVADQIITSTVDDSVTVLLMRACGRERERRIYRVGRKPVAVATAEVNEDGYMDFIVANELSRELHVFMNAPGALLAVTVVDLGAVAPVDIGVLDINSDQRVDVAVADRHGRAVVLLAGRGDGTFSEDTKYELPQRPTALVTTDLDRDGLADVAVVMDGPDLEGGMIVFRNTGGGALEQWQEISGLGGGASLASGDFNGDGLIDLAVGRTDGGAVTIFSGEVGGRVGPAIDLRFKAANLASGDFNGDGASDLFLSGVRNRLLLGSTWGLREGGADAGFGGGMARAGDLNGDGVLDVAVVTSDGVGALLGDGTGGVGRWELVEDTEPVGGGVIEDIDSDGILDVVVPTDAGVGLLRGKSDGTFVPRREMLARGEIGLVAVGDINDDGLRDIVSIDQQENVLSVLYGGTASTARSGFPAVASASGLAVVDVDSDGRDDALVSTFFGQKGGHHSQLLIGMSGGRGIDWAESVDLGSGVVRCVGTTDIDQDGVEEVLLLNSSSDEMVVLRQQGGGRFLIWQRIILGEEPQMVEVADIDGDGRSEVLVANERSNTIDVLKAGSDGRLERSQAIFVGKSPCVISSGDFNSDGHTDIVVGYCFRSRTLSVIAGQADGSFGEGQDFLIGGEAMWVGSGDVDRDGATDLVVFTAQPDGVRVLRNRITGPSTR